MSTNIHEGTPERLVTSFDMALLAIASIFFSKSLIRAIFLLGTRTQFTNGCIFCIRIAERSPTSPCLELRLGLWLPPKIKPCPEKKRLSGF